MKRLLVISDNHFQQKEFINIVNHYDDIDYYIHCGDSQWNPDNALLQHFTVVRGNNDFNSLPHDVLLEIENKKVLVTHGHTQYVYNYGDADNTSGTADLVTYALQEYGANVVLYGHTHVPEMHIDRDVFVLNPGSTNFPRGFQHRVQCYAIVTIDNDTVSANFYNAKTHEDITREITG